MTQARLTHHARRGFTVLELVVVLVIVATVLAVSVPAFAGGAGAAEPGDTDALVRTLRRARQTAVESARLTVVIVDPSTRRVWVRTDGPSPAVDTSFVLDAVSDVRFAAPAPRARFTFRPDGRADGAAVTVVSPRGGVSVRVMPANGDVWLTDSTAAPTGSASRSAGVAAPSAGSRAP